MPPPFVFVPVSTVPVPPVILRLVIVTGIALLIVSALPFPPPSIVALFVPARAMLVALMFVESFGMFCKLPLPTSVPSLVAFKVPFTLIV